MKNKSQDKVWNALILAVGAMIASAIAGVSYLVWEALK